MLLSRLFRLDLAVPHHMRLWRNYEMLYHANDFVAGVLFVVGSILFFWRSTEETATWLFLIGSILFTLRPGIHLARDLHLTRVAPRISGSTAPPVTTRSTAPDAVDHSPRP